MKLNAELSGAVHSLSLNVAGQQLIADVDGRSYELEVREIDGQHYLLIDGTRVYDTRIESSHENLIVHLRQQNYSVKVIDPKRLPSAHSGGSHDHGSAEIVAPMHGKVVRLLVAEGAEVSAGTGILVVEAMKMQNELKTPKAGVVTSIRAVAGATVNAGEVLAVIE